MHGCHDDQHQQHEQHRIFADALSFIVLDWFPKLQSVLPGRASVPNAVFLQVGADRPELSPRLAAPSLSANSIRGSMAQRGTKNSLNLSICRVHFPDGAGFWTVRAIWQYESSPAQVC